MIVYITGMSGMLGQQIRAVHLAAGDKVYGCDINPRHSGVVPLDIRNYEALVEHMGQVVPSRVYHCAAMLGVQNTEQNTLVCRDINEWGTEVAVMAALNSGAEEFIFLSSSEVYGGSIYPLKEDAPKNGNNVYAKSKLWGENQVLQRSGNMNVKICRMFNCYGAGQVAQFFLPKIMRQALSGETITLYGDPANVRSYLHGTDAANFIYDVANNGDAGEVYNIGHHELITLGLAASIVLAVTGENTEIVVNHGDDGYPDRMTARDVPNRVGCFDKLGTISSYKPATFFHGVEKLYYSAASLADDWVYDRTVYHG
jgi:nucleoside-diphosphate-sugar epimerase